MVHRDRVSLPQCSSRRLALPAVVAALLAASVVSGRAAALIGSTQATPNVSGIWQMAVMHDHAINFGLELKQEGKTLSGTVMVPALHGGTARQFSLAGEIVERAITLTATGDDEGATIVSITGTVKDDGTMEGSLEGKQGGKRQWTAERLK